MANYRRVLCAIDIGWRPGVDAPLDDGGTPLGQVAEFTLMAADREARLHGASLAIIHALPTMYPGAPMSPAGVEQTLIRGEELASGLIEAILSAVARLTPRDPADVSVEIADPPPDEAIIKGARRRASDLVVVGSGPVASGKPTLGKVATSVARHSHTSVLVARPGHTGGGIVLGYDFTPSGERAAAAAAEEVRRRRTGLTLVHSLDLLPPEMVLSEPGIGMMVPGTWPTGAQSDEAVRGAVRQRLLERLQSLGVPGDVEVTAGPPAHAIAEVAGRVGADLVIVGTSNRSGLDRLLLGSVSSKAVREAPCSVLVVRPSDELQESAPEGARL
jgi:nucleotide-binding universal stress UspA family protein